MMGDPMYSFPTSSGNRWYLLLYVESRSLSTPNILSYLSRAILHLTLSQRRQSYSSALVIRIHQKQIPRLIKVEDAWHTYLGLCNDSKSREGYLTQSCDVSFDVLMYTWQGLLSRCRLLYQVLKSQEIGTSWFFFTRTANHQPVTHDFVLTVRDLNLTRIIQWSKTKSTLL